MRAEVEAALEVLAAGTQFTALRRALFATVASRYLNIGAVGSEVPVDEGDGRLPLEVLLARLPTSTLASVATINKGRTGIKDAKPGRYPLVVTAEQRGTSDHFDFEGPGVMIPMVSSTGHGDASLKRVHFQDGQYAVGSILSVVQPRDPQQLSARYLHAYLSSFKDELLVSRMVGTANVSLTVAKIGEVPVPLLPIDAQRKVDELMALCDRLEARQQDAEAAHARLVQVLLGSLTQARDADEFQSSWQQVASQLTDIFTTDDVIDKLKQALLQLAVMGKLSRQRDDDEHAGQLMARLRESRNAMYATGGIDNPETRTMQRKLAELNPPVAPFPLPKGWATVSLIDCCLYLVDCHNKTAPYADKGIPIIRTSNIRERHFRMDDVRFVTEATYEFWSRRCPPRPGDIIFTREAPMGEAAIVPDGVTFCLGQRTMLIRPIHEFIDNQYLLIALTEPHLLERAAEHAIGSTVKHLRVGDVERLAVPLPPLAEQRRIVAKVTELLALCDQLKARIAAARAKQAQLAQALVEQAVA